MMQMRRSAAAILVGAIATTLLGITATSASALSADERSVARLVNESRADSGRAALALKSDLNAVARAHSQEMAALGKIFHSSSLADDVTGCWTLVGENVGTGPDAGTIHEAFMNSAPHRANVLGAYNQLGVGVATGDDGMLYVTHTFARRACAAPTIAKKTHPVKGAVGPRAPRARLVTPRPARARHAQAAQAVDMLVRLVDLDAQYSAT